MYQYNARQCKQFVILGSLNMLSHMKMMNHMLELKSIIFSTLNSNLHFCRVMKSIEWYNRLRDAMHTNCVKRDIMRVHFLASITEWEIMTINNHIYPVKWKMVISKRWSSSMVIKTAMAGSKNTTRKEMSERKLIITFSYNDNKS